MEVKTYKPKNELKCIHLSKDTDKEAFIRVVSPCPWNLDHYKKHYFVEGNDYFDGEDGNWFKIVVSGASQNFHYNTWYANPGNNPWYFDSVDESQFEELCEIVGEDPETPGLFIYKAKRDLRCVRLTKDDDKDEFLKIVCPRVYNLEHSYKESNYISDGFVVYYPNESGRHLHFEYRDIFLEYPYENGFFRFNYENFNNHFYMI